MTFFCFICSYLADSLDSIVRFVALLLSKKQASPSVANLWQNGLCTCVVKIDIRFSEPKDYLESF